MLFGCIGQGLLQIERQPREVCEIARERWHAACWCMRRTDTADTRLFHASPCVPPPASPSVRPPDSAVENTGPFVPLELSHEKPHGEDRKPA